MKISSKTTDTLIALFLMFAMAFSLFALPFVNAQAAPIMNLPGPEGEIHYVLIHAVDYDIDLNGGPGALQNCSLFVKYPGRTDFTYIGTYLTSSSGDLDIYDFDFNETGDFELKWINGEPGNYGLESNVETARVVATTAEIPPQSYHTYIYVTVSRKVIGVGQDILLVYWTDEMPPDTGEQEGLVPSPTGRQGWYDVQLVITKPDGTNETIDMPYSDPVGGGYILYTPTEVGNYSFKAIFPETLKEHVTTGARDLYLAAESPVETFTVQEEPIEEWPESPLPNDYWTRPVSSAARGWHVLTANYLGGAADYWPLGGAGGGTNNFAYGLAQESAHILWSKPFYTGGVMDVRHGTFCYQTSHYQGVSFSTPVILNGMIHTDDIRFHMGTAHLSEGWQVIDLYSGETLFEDSEQNDPSFGQVYLYESGNQHGGFAYLWRTSGVELPERVNYARAQQFPNMSVVRISSARLNRPSSEVRTGTLWEMIDARTLKTVCYIANVSSGGTAVYGKDGSILRYSTAMYGGEYYLRIWNSSAGTMIASQHGTGAWQWRPMGGGGFGAFDNYFGSVTYNNVHNGELFWVLNVSIPSLEGPRNSLLNQTMSIECVREGEYIIFATSGRNDERGIVKAKIICLSLERGSEGNKLWETTLTPPAGSLAANFSISQTGVFPEDGVVLYEDDSRIMKRWAYDMTTGELLWESEPEPQLMYYGMSEYVYQGKLISYGSYAGTLTCYNITTGEILWTYKSSPVGFESPYGNYPMSIGRIADGKIYTYTSEHSYTSPLYRGPNLRCINATDGTEIWSILDFGGGLAIADGRLLSSNSMDLSIYCYGKGPSATTVTASPKVSVHGTSVLVEGTVTDQTPSGRRNINDGVDWTLKGTPAICDEDMSAWMEYLFMQQAYPADAKGVEVVLETLDPNGNFYEIGRTTSDITGNYGVMWEPPVPGEYTIIASFAGSASYGPSQAITYMGVDDAPEPTPGPTPTPAPMTDTYVIGFGSAAVIAIVIGFAILILLRKR